MRLKFIAKGDLEAAADQTRYKAFKDGVEDNYPLSVDDIAEFHLGYDLYYDADLPTRIDGCSDSANKLISIGRHITYDTRRRFTVAHEIGHIVLHFPAMVAQAKYQDALFELPREPVQDDRLEYQANFFAAALLMPKEVMNKAFGERLLKGEYIREDEVAHYFDVSLQAAGVRMRELRFTTQSPPGESLIP